MPMTPLVDSFSTVIVGQWNPNVFRPEWVKEHLAESPESIIEVAFPLGDATLPRRVHVDNLFIFPSASRLDIRSAQSNAEQLNRTCQLGKRCLQLLSHTPISAIGINLSFSAKLDEFVTLANLFIFDDDASIDSKQFRLQEAVIKRGFLLDSGAVLNMTLSHNTVDVQVEFNFHFEVKNAMDAVNIIDANPAHRLFEIAEKFMTDTHNISLEQEAL